MTGEWTVQDTMGARNLWQVVLNLNIQEALGINCYTSGKDVQRNGSLSIDMSKAMIEEEKFWFKALCDFAGMDWRYVKRIYNKAKNNPELINHAGFTSILDEVAS